VLEKAETSVAIDVIWRTHMVHPRIYAADCSSKGAFMPLSYSLLTQILNQALKRALFST
jgi:hypothetical protein